jgi:trimethylamine--corrinoid protein Co-methyltransferase
MRRGRKARLEKPPEQSAVAPGLMGGKFKPLADAEIQNIHHTMLDVLENIGMADPIPIVQERVTAGCVFREHSSRT